MASGNEEGMCLPANENQLQEMFLKDKRHPAMQMANSAIKMKRSPNQAFILLLGLNGAGKSSMVNYMFGTNVVDLHDFQSEKRSVIEYTVKQNSTAWRIPDLKLSIIDTPGFCDIDGIEMDAKNIMSIKYFLRSHPNIQENYPNLVMIVMNIQDNRIEGEHSCFARMLKCIGNVNAIDRCNPNVVVVLTHAASIGSRPKYWEEKVELKKAQVQAIVENHLGINPEIVVHENQPLQNDLQRVGDCYLLPNGDKQPKILYQACKRIFNKANDKIGYEAVDVCLRQGMNKSVTMGRVIDFKTVELKMPNSYQSTVIELLSIITSRKDEWMSLPKNEKELQDLFLSGKRHPAMKMADIAMKMKRSPNQVFILLVGLTGAGKSSTINYLFGTNVAETSSSKSATRSTIEYKVNNKSTEWGISNLPISIIDTPGFSDTDGLKQDAKNVMSIQYFLEKHPHIRKSYPNVVMIVINIMDNRIEGESSNLAKMLKGLSKVNAIDHCNPNVVVVLTHAAAIPRKCWIEKVGKIKAQIQAIVQIFLGINSEIVVQENEPDNNELVPDGDWYLLPNGDKQPKILFQACKRILNRAKDEIGHEAVAVCFRNGNNKINTTVGESVSSSDVKKDDAIAMHEILDNSIESISPSEVGSMLDNYKMQKNENAIDNAIAILKVRFRDIGIKTTHDLQSMSMNMFMEKMYPIRITQDMQKIVKDVFGLTYEQSSGFNYQVGKGYNIFRDSTTVYSPLDMQIDDKVQYGLPSNVKLNECASFEVKCESIKDANDYVSRRLKDLQVDIGGGINFGAFDLSIRSGYNDSSVSRNSSSQTLNQSTFSVEHRINHIEVQQPYTTTMKFKADVIALPADYDQRNESNMLEWKAFFDKWGMYVVIGAYIGGSLTGQVNVMEGHFANNAFEDAQTALSMKMSFLQNETAMDFSKEQEQSNTKKHVSTIRSSSLTWSGGSRKTYKTSLENIDRNDWIAWVESLEKSPVPLWSYLELLPLYHLVSEVSPEKGTKMQMAMNLALKGEFTYTPPREDDRKTVGKSNDSGGDGCFHADSLVMLYNRKLKRIKDLLVGDKILTIDSNGSLVQDEVIAWIHQVRTGQFIFLQIDLDLGKIILTPEHIIFVGKSRNPQHASTLRPGDKLSFFSNYDDRQTVSTAIVLSVHKVEGRGIYAPLTYSGRLLVDNIDVSCYCTLNPLQIVGQNIISSHALAHAGFLPLRMAFKFGLNINNSQFDYETGIHGYARWLMKVILGK